MALAYVCYLVIGPAFPLAAIGLISFAAVAQFAPALIGGMFWRGRPPPARSPASAPASSPGSGPSRSRPSPPPGWLPPELLADGPFGVAGSARIGARRPALDPLLHGMLWSLGPNLALYVGVSLLTEPERRRATTGRALRRHARRDAAARAAAPRRLARRPARLAARYVGRERADVTFHALAAARAGGDERQMLARSDAEAVQATERLLASAIGSASARVVVASLLSDRRFSRSDARELIDDACAPSSASTRSCATRCRTSARASAPSTRTSASRSGTRGSSSSSTCRPRWCGRHASRYRRYNEARGEYGQGQFDTLLARRRDPRPAASRTSTSAAGPDGTVLEVSTNPLPSGGFVAVYTDVTERDRAAAALRDANEALEERVGERTVALSAAKAEAERANLGKTRFMAAAGHDLLQPLQAARLFLSALAERVTDPAVGQIDASLIRSSTCSASCSRSPSSTAA